MQTALHILLIAITSHTSLHGVDKACIDRPEQRVEAVTVLPDRQTDLYCEVVNLETIRPLGLGTVIVPHFAYLPLDVLEGYPRRKERGPLIYVSVSTASKEIKENRKAKPDKIVVNFPLKTYHRATT